jgi:hypothetical protein
MAMTAAADPFLGRWTLNVRQSSFDANHRPSEATLTFELDDEGYPRMTAEGRNQHGEPVIERPTRFVTDGVERPVPDLPQLKALATRPNRYTLHAVARRADGSVVGESMMVVSPDGRSLTATNSGVDAQLRTFSQVTVWDRVVDGSDV